MKSPNNSVNTSYFSEAELRVVELLVRGYSEKEIASKLFISERTVNNHTRNIRERYGLHKNIQIVAVYLASLRNKEFSLPVLKELGISAFLVLVNLCEYKEGLPL